MFGRERCSLGCDHVLNSCFERRNKVQLSLTHDRFPLIDQCPLRTVQAKQDGPLGEEYGFRGIDVFSGLGVCL